MNRLTASSLFAVFLFGCSGQINPIDSGPVGGAGGAPPGTSGAGGAPPTGSGGMGLGTGGIAKGGAPGVGGTASGGGPAGGAPAGGASGGAPPVAGGSSGGGAPAGGGTGGSGKGGATPGEGGMGPLGGMGGTGGAGMGGEAMGGGGTGGTETEPIPKHTIPEDPCAPRENYRNLFVELLGKTKAEVEEKLNAAFEHLFYGGNDAKIYYPVGADEAYVLDVNNNDVRSEGMSYGMMVAVQMNKQEEFDRLWKWAKAHTQQPNGYFGWKASTSGQLIDSGPAPDGEEYFATALIFADHRWGTGKHNYGSDARNLLNAIRNNGAFNANPPVIKFVPSVNYSDPSYVLPAFYQVWACYDAQNRSFWEGAVSHARNFFHTATHSQTGLAPYLSDYNGNPHNSGPNFNSDSWRVVGNIMMDYHFFQADSWQVTFAERYANFFKNANPGSYEFTLNGNALQTVDDPVKGLVAQNALVAFAVPEELGAPALEALWELDFPTGQYRYYDGMLYLFALLHASGNFRLY